jgi:hypothetical protein
MPPVRGCLALESVVRPSGGGVVMFGLFASA